MLGAKNFYLMSEYSLEVDFKHIAHFDSKSHFRLNRVKMLNFVEAKISIKSYFKDLSYDIKHQYFKDYC